MRSKMLLEKYGYSFSWEEGEMEDSLYSGLHRLRLLENRIFLLAKDYAGFLMVSVRHLEK